MRTFTIDEARVLVDALEHRRMTAPADEEGYLGRWQAAGIDPEALPDYVAARRAEYEEHRRRRAEIERRWEELGTAYIGPEPLEIGVNVDLDEFVATLRAMSPEERREIVSAIQQMPDEDLDEDGNLEPDPHWVKFTYQYLTVAGLVEKPARPFMVYGYWYESEWRAPHPELGEMHPEGDVYRCYERMAGPFATWDEANAVAEQFRARERAENPTLWRRRFAVRDIRDRREGREPLQHSPEEVEALLPPEQRRPQA